MQHSKDASPQTKQKHGLFQIVIFIGLQNKHVSSPPAHWTATAFSSPTGRTVEGAATRQPGLCWLVGCWSSLRPVSQPQKHTWCNCQLLQFVAAHYYADGAGSTANSQQPTTGEAIPPPPHLPSPPGSETTWDSRWRAETKIRELKSQLVEMRLCKHITS